MEDKYCKCGCGSLITSKWQKYQDIKYIKGHGRKGKNNSFQHNQTISSKNKNGKEIECSYCKKSFYSQMSKIKNGKKYCSKNCYTQSMIGISPSKESIEKSRLSRIGHIVTESTRKKISLANSGEGNGQWKEITIEKIKHSIRKRDNFICLMCGLHQEKNKKSLDVHHIDYIETNNIPKNLISLCHSCHAKTNKSKREFWIEHCHLILNDKYDYEYTYPITFEIINNNEMEI